MPQEVEMRRLLVLLSAVGLFFAMTMPAGAITNGEPDTENEFPFVAGAIGPLDQEALFLCTAWAISDTYLVTAAHCFQDLEDPPGDPRPVAVLFGPDLFNPAHVGLGTWIPDPEFCVQCGNGLPGFDTHDVAVIALASPVPIGVVPHYAQLPDEGLVDTLPHRTDLTQVGYGVQEILRGGGQPVPTIDGLRHVASAELLASKHVHSDEYVKFTQNPGNGKGGTCFGDSGGPNLIAGTNIAISVNSYVTNGNCSGVGYSNRIDTYALEFIEDITRITP
jgi:secreted trypsin-like serine protease